MGERRGRKQGRNGVCTSQGTHIVPGSLFVISLGPGDTLLRRKVGRKSVRGRYICPRKCSTFQPRRETRKQQQNDDGFGAAT